MKPQLTKCTKCDRLCANKDWVGDPCTCPCHLPTLESDWEKRFSDVFYQDFDSFSAIDVKHDDVKSFITGLLSAHRHSLIREIKKLKRTDETQMSHDHTYDEALDDVVALLSHLDK